MCVLVKHSDGEHYMISMACIFDLPEDVQAKVKAAMAEYIKSNNQIVQIAMNALDRYDVYVVNGKPIAIEDNALDIDNPDHLADIVSTAKDLFCVPDLPAIYKEDTICIFIPYADKEYCRSMIGISDMTGLPDDIVKKVKAVMNGYVKN